MSRPDSVVAGSLESALVGLLSEFQHVQSQTETETENVEGFDQLAALDLRLRTLLESADFLDQARLDGASTPRIIATLQAIERIHGALIGAAAEQRRSIVDTIHQLHHDQRAAHAYARVVRHSF